MQCCGPVHHDSIQRPISTERIVISPSLTLNAHAQHLDPASCFQCFCGTVHGYSPSLANASKRSQALRGISKGPSVPVQAFCQAKLDNTQNPRTHLKIHAHTHNLQNSRIHTKERKSDCRRLCVCACVFFILSATQKVLRSYLVVCVCVYVSDGIVSILPGQVAVSWTVERFRLLVFTELITLHMKSCGYTELKGCS